MWCPKCKNEYVKGITICADCDCALVTSLEEYEAKLAEEQTVCLRDDIDMANEEHDSSITAEPVSNETTSAPARAYVSKKAKAEDMKSTAYTFTLIGALGIVCLILFATGVLPVQTAEYMKLMICIVMGTMFFVFLVVGIRSFGQLKSMTSAADSEEDLLNEVLKWFKSTYNACDIDENLDTTQPEELLYFARYEKMRQLLSEQYSDIDDSLSDHMIETLYAELFN